MTEPQIWFILIFSIPFIPAVVVFLLIKPESGDAKVGGTIPILKDLRLELGGAIATYVVIALIAIFAYTVIIADDRITVRLVPTDGDQRAINVERVNLENLEGATFALSITGSDGARISLTRDNFVLGTAPLQFLAEPAVIVKVRDWDRHLTFRVESGDFAVRTESLPATRNGEYTIAVELAPELLADWFAEYIGQSVRWDGNLIVYRGLSVLKDNSGSGLRRIAFGIDKTPGLAKISLDVWEGDAEATSAFLSEVEQALLAFGNDSRKAIRSLEGELLDAIAASLFEHKDWTAPHESQPLEADQEAPSVIRFVNAPSPRIDLPDVRPGRFIVIRRTIEYTYKNFGRDLVHGFGYDFPTRLSTIEVLDNDIDGAEGVAAPRLSKSGVPQGVLAPSDFRISSGEIWIKASNLPRLSSVEVRLPGGS